MITGIDLTATVDYVLKDDKDNPTIWKLGTLTSLEMSEIAKNSTITDYMPAMISLVRKGLRGWSNFKIGDSEVEFKREDGLVSIALMNIIPFQVIIELGVKLLEVNKLTPSEIKN